ncbi:MAG TPA: hypothetical protein VFQ61_03100 [Polyangiaceae bacterium]|nr:hypothetical protein [Polyangiaceae bacterium]
MGPNPHPEPNGGSATQHAGGQAGQTDSNRGGTGANPSPGSSGEPGASGAGAGGTESSESSQTGRWLVYTHTFSDNPYEVPENVLSTTAAIDLSRPNTLPIELGTSPYAVPAPSFSPDGHWLVHGIGTQTVLRQVRGEGFGAPTSLPGCEGQSSEVTWSARGTWLACLSSTPTAQLYSISRVDTGGERRLVDARSCSPRFAPDDDHIVITCFVRAPEPQPGKSVLRVESLTGSGAAGIVENVFWVDWLSPTSALLRNTDGRFGVLRFGGQEAIGVDWFAVDESVSFNGNNMLRHSRDGTRALLETRSSTCAVLDTVPGRLAGVYDCHLVSTDLDRVAVVNPERGEVEVRLLTQTPNPVLFTVPGTEVLGWSDDDRLLFTKRLSSAELLLTQLESVRRTATISPASWDDEGLPDLVEAVNRIKVAPNNAWAVAYGEQDSAYVDLQEEPWFRATGVYGYGSTQTVDISPDSGAFAIVADYGTGLGRGWGRLAEAREYAWVPRFGAVISSPYPQPQTVREPGSVRIDYYSDEGPMGLVPFRGYQNAKHQDLLQGFAMQP